jgi:hypothetical protein
MEAVTLQTTDAMRLHVKTGKKRDGILGALGLSETESIESLLCPECGLLRNYVDIEA